MKELIKDKYPYLPTSVIRMNRSKRVQKLKVDRKGGWGNDKYSANSSRKKKGNFNLELAEFILKYYARDSKVIFDPFSGWGERGYVANKLGYKYIGLDCSKEAVDYAKEHYDIGTINWNSQKTEFKYNIFDFCYTCPPYWNLEKYERGNGQLSDIKDYQEFLKEITKNIYETYAILKPGALCAWVVGDFRIKGKFYDYSTDLINIFRKVGFELFDKVIIDKSVNYRISLFMPQADRLGYTVKLHEYLLVFKKEE